MQNDTNASNDREFLGLTQNECILQGKVTGDPVIYNENYAYLSLRVAVEEQGANGQWNDIPIQVPVVTTDPNKVALLNKYVKDGRELLLYTYYKPWMNQGQPQHAFFIKKLKFGRKKWEPKTNNQAPGMPIS